MNHLNFLRGGFANLNYSCAGYFLKNAVTRTTVSDIFELDIF